MVVDVWGRMWRAVAPLACAVTAALSIAGPAPAQDVPEAERTLLRLSAEEARALRKIAREPVPAGADVAALRRHFYAKDDAIKRLGDPALSVRVLREAMEALPKEPRWANNLAWALREQGAWSESRQMIERAVEAATSPTAKVFYRAARVRMMVHDRVAGAADALAEVQADAKALLPTLAAASNDRITTLRSLGSLARSQASLAAQAAQPQAVLAAELEAGSWYRDALAEATAKAGDQQNSLATVAADLAGAQRGRAAALSLLGRFAEAEAAHAEHIDFIGKHRLPASFAAGAHHDLAGLMMLRGDYARAEQQLRLALDVLDKLNYPQRAPARLSKWRDIAVSLWARDRAADARRAFDELDRAAGAKPDTPPRSYAFDRGLVYLGAGAADKAVPLFEQWARDLRERLGPAHYYTAQAEGLHGAALRQGEDAARREAGADLLRQAVVTMLSPRNADYFEDLGIRRKVRTLIFDAYLEASAERGAMQAMAALGVADHLIGGGTGQAVADAALRSAAGNPALADLVRQEQDARARLRALQQAPSADAKAGSDDPERRQVAEIEAQRQQLQDRIRLGFPGYDRLVQPPLPNASEVAQRLARDEVLLLALPTQRGLYLWALTADELPTFVRVDVGAATLAGLVTRLRAGLDLGNSGGRVPRFDTAAAHELYRHVLAPVAARLAGRKHLVVATTGPLATVPLSVLLTAPPSGGPSPWLARQLAVSTVPNVASWLALRQLPAAQPAPEPLLAWADPRYASAPAPARPAAGDAGPRQRGQSASAPAERAVRYDMLPPLPETRGEALAIAAALRAKPESDILVGERATRTSVLEASRSGALARKRVLLFATHGLMAGDLPGLEQPALALAAEPGRRDLLAPLLGLDDILGLKLNAGWVVLSACNTAAADGRAGEALSGLARGFLYAGTRSLLVTHWAVETESARLLTTATFEHHAADPKASKAESLRQAMLKVMAMPKYVHPAYWAPFALVGDGAR